MKYLILNLVVLGLTVALSAKYWRKLPSRSRWHTVLVLLVLTLGFDNMLVSMGTVDYIAGSVLRIGLAPVEDFAYAIAAAIVMPVVWELLKTSAPTKP